MRTKKVFLWVGIVLVVVVVVLLLGRNFAHKTGVQSGVKKSLGMKLAISKINVGLFRSDIRVEGLTVYNPEGFEGELLADLPLIFVDYELGPMFKDKIHLSEVELNLKELVVVRNKKGEVNLNRLKAVAAGRRETPAEKAPEKKREMKIDRLVLTIDRVKFVDYSAAGGPKVLEIRIGVDHEEFTNLSSVDDIVRVVALRTIVSAGLTDIGITVEDLVAGLADVRSEEMRMLEELDERGREALEEVDEEVKARLEEAEEKAEDFLEKLKIPEKK